MADITKRLMKSGVDVKYIGGYPSKATYKIKSYALSHQSDKKETKKIRKVIKNICKDYRKKLKVGRFDERSMGVVLDNKSYFNKLEKESSYLFEKSKKQRDMLDLEFAFNNKFRGVMTGVGAVTGVVAAVVYSYPEVAETATNFANFFNDKSDLWAPIAGLTQSVISLGGSALAVILGAAGGSIVGNVAAYVVDIFRGLPYGADNKFKSYKEFNTAIQKLKPKPKKVVKRKTVKKKTTKKSITNKK